jgi:hypothetical protein
MKLTTKWIIEGFLNQKMGATSLNEEQKRKTFYKNLVKYKRYLQKSRDVPEVK